MSADRGGLFLLLPSPTIGQVEQMGALRAFSPLVCQREEWSSDYELLVELLEGRTFTTVEGSLAGVEFTAWVFDEAWEAMELHEDVPYLRRNPILAALDVDASWHYGFPVGPAVLTGMADRDGDSLPVPFEVFRGLATCGPMFEYRTGAPVEVRG